MPRARRLPKAVLLALLTALVLGALVGVQAGGGPGSADGSIHLAKPAIGDRWTYQAVVAGAWNFGPNDDQRAGQPFPYAEFAWVEPTLVRDADGREAPADLLHVRMLDYYDDPEMADLSDGHLWVPDEDRYLVPVGGWDAFAHESRISSQEGSSAGAGVGVVNNVAVLQTDNSEVVTGWSRYLGTTHAPCLARTYWQDNGIGLGEPLLFPDDCLPQMDDDWSWDSLGEFRFAARETVAGRLAYRFDANGQSLWFSEDVPVPVQWTGFGPDRSIALTLSSFTPGDIPLGTLGPVAGGSVAPAVVMAPRQVWGPDDSGVDHPFPASVAYQAALEHLAWPDLRQWTATHPDGATFLLEYSEDLQATPPERSWFFAMGDGSDVFAFVVSQGDSGPSPVPLPVNPFTLPFDMWFTFLMPEPGQMPAEIPTVASTLARWESYQALEGREEQPNGWAMAIVCSVDCSYGSFGTVAAGRDPVAALRMEVNYLETGVRLADLFPRTFTGSQISVDAATGTTKAMVNWTGYDSGLTVAGLEPHPPVDPNPTPAPESKPRLVLATLVPTAEQGAAITAASAIAGLLYWLWPTLKGGAAGLFSRVTGPQLLDHPARARLVQLVQAEPGIHFQDLVRRSSLPNGTAVHHLHKLTEAGLLAARPLGRYTCYFPGSSPDRQALAAAPVTRADGARRILAELAANPGLSGGDLAVRLGLQPSTVTYHVKRLQDAGLVSAARDGRVIRLRTVGAAGAA